MYEIARYFSEDARRYAASFAYRPTALGLRAVVEQCEDDWGACPLGVCLFHDHDLDADDFAPCPSRVAHFLIDWDGVDTPWEIVREQASAFTTDWDGGRIADLGAALGIA